MREWIAAASVVATVALAWPAQASAQCTVQNIITCGGMGGYPVASGSSCWCHVYEWVPRRAINADNGDVGIVPIDGRGDAVVATLTQEIGQLHRHAVMFYGDGRYTRHNTMELDTVELLTPLIGKVRFDGDDLANGLPGAISQTIDATYDSGRLADTGLVLKPQQQISLDGGFPPRMTVIEPNRPLFEAAVTSARYTQAYYKLSDYTSMDSMSRPWSSSRTGDLRGSHCSGYATEFYRDQGLALANVTYPQAMRQDVAEVLFDEVREQCRNKTGIWQDILLGITGHWNACTNIANQVVNCFADLGCGNTSSDWRSGVGSGYAVSPDNLLPDAFRYTGSQNYNWDGTVLSSTDGGGGSPILGREFDHPGLSGSAPTTSSTSVSPFQRVEALRYTGGYAVHTHTVRL